MKAIDMIKGYEPCEDAVQWLGNRTVEQMVNECERGDWLLWLAKKMDIDLQPLTLAKARCAKTVIHLMKDERSIKAVEVAERFGMGLANREELDAAADAAATYTTAAYAAAYAAADAATYATAAYAAASSAADAAYAAASAYADASAYDASAYASRKENQKQTADICRSVFGEWMIFTLKTKK